MSTSRAEQDWGHTGFFCQERTHRGPKVTYSWQKNPLSPGSLDGQGVRFAAGAADGAATAPASFAGEATSLGAGSGHSSPSGTSSTCASSRTVRLMSAENWHQEMRQPGQQCSPRKSGPTLPKPTGSTYQRSRSRLPRFAKPRPKRLHLNAQRGGKFTEGLSLRPATALQQHRNRRLADSDTLGQFRLRQLPLCHQPLQVAREDRFLLVHAFANFPMRRRQTLLLAGGQTA
jgi:hypothetical protein